MPVSGAKNSALKLMAATLLAPGKTTLQNVPDISDVHVMGKVLKGMTIKIPVTGTVSQPRLDTSALQNMMGGLIKNAVGERAAEKVGTFLEKLQEELQKQ